MLVLYSALAGHALASAAADRLSFAEGAIPLRVEADPAAGVRIEQALRAIDGSDGLFVLTRPVPPDSRVSLYYELPAPTVFERFAVPRVAETPSPRQSFVREVEVWGSAQSPTAGFVKLASGTLAAHRRRGESTVLTLHDSTPVRWVRLDLRGVLDPAVPALTMEFSEIVGEGQAPAVPAASGFGGHWQGRGLVMSLQQQGTVVSGCYDRGNGRLQGTVSGRVMHATGSATKTGVLSVFVAVLQDDGTMQLLRSSNGAPFYHFTGNSATQGVKDCPQAEPPALSCGSQIHGIRFDFDSAVIRPSSAPVLQALHDGLAAVSSARIGIVGHTSSEGTVTHNQRLSEQRAQAVVEALTGLGLARTRLSASGAGPSEPIASNDDEAGRSLNRRVEIRCQP